MAVDPRLLLQGRVADVGKAFNNALLNIQGFEGIKQRRAQTERDAQLQPLREQLLQAQVQTAQQGVQTPQQQFNQRQLDNLNSVANFSRQNLEIAAPGPNQNLPLLAQRLSTRRAQLVEAKLPTTETDQAFQLLEQNPALLASEMSQAIQAQDALSGRGGLTASQREFAGLTGDLTPEDLTRAKRIELGLDPRASISAQERIAGNPSLTAQVAESGAIITGAEEEAKLGQQLKLKPKIQKAVKLAEEEAKAQGESLTSLKRAEAALPGLLETVAALKELAPIATSTLSGKVFDAAAKELGFGATKGATARARFVATVSNQVLPLLRDTFGAAFTKDEGDELKAAMSDPDSSEGEKIAQLEAFIEQKQRSIATTRREVGAPQAAQSQPATVLRFDAQGNQIQ